MTVQNEQLTQRQTEFDVLSAVGERLTSAKTPQEIVLWTQVRGEVSRQNEDAADRKHTRKLEKTQLYGKIGLSIVAIGIGVILIYLGYPFAGLFTIGAGLFWLAPDFVTSFFDRFQRKGWNEDE